MTGERIVDRWEDVGAADEFVDREGQEVRIGARQIAVFKVDDTFYAIKDVCPHAAELLSYGEIQVIEDRISVQCPGHGWCFALDDGACTWGAPGVSVTRYPVKLEGGRVLIGI